jgi:hypothetical protein
MPLRKAGIEFGRRNLDAAPEHNKLYPRKGQLRESVGRSSFEIANGDQVCTATTRDAASFTMSEAENGCRMRGDKVVNDCEIYCMIRTKTLYFVKKVATRSKWRVATQSFTFDGCEEVGGESLIEQELIRGGTKNDGCPALV